MMWLCDEMAQYETDVRLHCAKHLLYYNIKWTKWYVELCSAWYFCLWQKWFCAVGAVILYSPSHSRSEYHSVGIRISLRSNITRRKANITKKSNCFFHGAANRNWTGDLVLTKDALYHLSHSSMKLYQRLDYYTTKSAQCQVQISIFWNFIGSRESRFIISRCFSDNAHPECVSKSAHYHAVFYRSAAALSAISSSFLFLK